MRHYVTLLAILALACAAAPVAAETLVANAGPNSKSRYFDKSSVFEPRSVLVVGDSLSLYFGERLESAFKTRNGVAFARLGKVSSGLAAPSFFNWPEHLKELVDRHRPDLVLIMLGANDNKPLRDAAGKSHAFGTQTWEAEYNARVQRLIDISRAHDPSVRVFWVGAPVMAKPQFDQEIRRINAAIKAQCERNTAAFYIDTHDVLADAGGVFIKTKANATGSIVRVRADDGVHLTLAGAGLLAERALDAVAANGGAIIHPLPRAEAPFRIAAAAPREIAPMPMHQVRPAPELAAQAEAPLKMHQAPPSAELVAQAGSHSARFKVQSNAAAQVSPQPAAQAAEEPIKMRRVQPSREFAVQTKPAPAPLADARSTPEPKVNAPAESPALASNDAAPGMYGVQESAWVNKAQAQQRAQLLQAKGLQSRVVTADLGAKGVWHRVVIGGVANMASAQDLQNDLIARFNIKNTLIRKLG